MVFNVSDDNSSVMIAPSDFEGDNMTVIPTDSEGDNMTVISNAVPRNLFGSG